MSAWDDAVNREFVDKLWDLAEKYESEAELIADLANFGGDVLNMMQETDVIEYGNKKEPKE